MTKLFDFDKRSIVAKAEGLEDNCFFFFLPNLASFDRSLRPKPNLRSYIMFVLLFLFIKRQPNEKKRNNLLSVV